jgi:YD repeat-containing protein
MLSLKKTISIACLIGFNFTAISGQFEPEIGEPTYSVIDENHVNALSRSIYYRLDDVGIGNGSLALKHSITLSSTNMLNHGAQIEDTPRHWGYKDKFVGGIYRTLHTDNFEECPLPESGVSCNSSRMADFYYIRVYDDVASYQFFVNDEGQFEPMTDKLISLKVQSDRRGYILTRKDGVQVYFATSHNTIIPNVINKNYEPYGIMTKIVNPNGLEINIHRRSPVYNIEAQIRSVTSNNGLQLKYIYEDDNRAVPSSTQQKLDDANKPNRALSFSQLLPRRIIALNNAVERCPLLADTCNLQNTWPTVEYTWPIAVPYSMYVERTIFTVKDAYGVITDFHHYPHYKEASFRIPRIDKIKNNLGHEVTYGYSATGGEAPIGDHSNSAYMSMLAASGALNFSSGKGGNVTYQVNGYPLVPYSGAGARLYNIGGAYKGLLRHINMYHRSTQFYEGRYALTTSPYEIETWDKKVFLDKDFQNKVTEIENKLTGDVTWYEYDNLGRLTLNNTSGSYTAIQYPYSYNGQCGNYRFCHKPIAVSTPYEIDWVTYRPVGEVSYTIYAYHSASGNIESIRYPKNNQNKQAKTVFNYQQYNARYRNDAGTMITSSQPIWLLSSEFSCQNSNVNGSNCIGNDKVVTSYEYGSGNGSNNLFLQGKTITSEADNKSRTYCYKYDKYGNQIEESRPKSGITNCNNGREF